MIIVQLTGGLGNQMFQYAIGRMLSIKHNTQLKLDISFFENYEWHAYSLEPFCLEASIATKLEVEQMFKNNKKNIERIKRKFFNEQPIIINEKSFCFDQSYLNIKNNRYLIGYWQSEKYFEQIAFKIHQELSIKVVPSEVNKQMLKDIDGESQAVSLHIRRGNYVTVDFVNKTHGTTTLDYYYKAINLIEQKCNKPVFYIFSDDINWAKENIKLNHKHIFIDNNDAKTDYEDLRLMSSCKHNILANSTFSWWAAWLNKNVEKIVIAPKQWFANLEMNSQTGDLIPSEWIKL